MTPPIPNRRRAAAPRALLLAGALAAATLAARAASSQEDQPLAPPARVAIGERVPDLRFVDLEGRPGRLSDFATSRALVIAVRVPGCPEGQRIGPRLAAFERELPARGAALLLLDPTADGQRDDAREDRERFGFLARGAIDRGGAFGQVLGVRTTCDLVVLDAARRLRYRGPLDDGAGEAAGAPREGHALAALDALLAGERIGVPERAPPGCPLEFPANVPAGAVADDVPTWSSRIAGIAAARCETCHCTGGAGPFPLSSPDDFDGASGMVREALHAGIMPPWVATADSGPFVHDLRLRDDEKLDLLRWLQEGCPQGDPEFRQPPRVAPRGWQIGEPDLIVESPQAVEIPASGVVDYLTLDAQSGLEESVWVDAVQILCEHPSICHHIGVRQVQPGGRGQEFVAFYLPGTGPTVLPEGFAFELRKGAVIRFDFHYTPDGTATTERTRIGFRFAKEPPRQRISGRILARNVPLSIPPGDPAHEVVYEHRFPADTMLRRLIPHMHLRGKWVEVELVAPDGAVTRPLDLARWDPDWQFVYEFVEPIAVAAGTKLRCRHLFDNSAANPRNPDPTAHVRGGPQIWDEMACIYVETFNDASEPPPRWGDPDRARLRRERMGWPRDGRRGGEGGDDGGSDDDGDGDGDGDGEGSAR